MAVKTSDREALWAELHVLRRQLASIRGFADAAINPPSAAEVRAVADRAQAIVGELTPVEQARAERYASAAGPLADAVAEASRQLDAAQAAHREALSAAERPARLAREARRSADSLARIAAVVAEASDKVGPARARPTSTAI